MFDLGTGEAIYLYYLHLKIFYAILYKFILDNSEINLYAGKKHYILYVICDSFLLTNLETITEFSSVSYLIL